MLQYAIYMIKHGICTIFGHKLDDGPADWHLGDDFEYWDCQRCGGLCADKWEEAVSGISFDESEASDG